MKPMRTLLLALTTMVLVASAASAQGREGEGDGVDRLRPARRPDAGGRREGRGRRDPGGQATRPGRGDQPAQPPAPRLEQVLRQLDLNERQRVQIDRILREAREQGRQQRTEAAEALRQAAEALRQARRNGDEEAAEQARQRLQALREGQQQTLQNLRRQIAAVLTPEQRERLDRLMGPGGRFDAFLQAVRAIELQPAQQRQIRQIAAEADAGARTRTSDEEKARTYRQAHAEIMDLLTEEQKDALRRQVAQQERRREMQGVFADLDLTAEQRQSVERIQAEVREQVASTDSPEARREALRQGQRRIITEVLTDEQRLQLRRQMRDRFGPGAGPEDRPAPREGRREGQRGPREGGRGDRGPRGGDQPVPPAP
ncbi:MAG: periplasmic heavy metal sensor [Planctomycetes bacterium]|nr:periplasmic heavy metal sensor [Planctomycetota bacterium]